MFTPSSSRSNACATRAAITTIALTALLITGCSGSAGSPVPSGMDHAARPPAASHHDGMPGMPGMPTGDGLTDEAAGFRFTPVMSSLSADQPGSVQFRITGTDGKPVTALEPDQTKLMHFYLIRSDLSGFQHVHPTMSPDGTWTAPLAAAQPGVYRMYTSFIAKDTSGTPVPLVLSQRITVPGTPTVTPLPAPSATTQVDGYTLKLTGDQLMAGMTHPLTVTVSKHGQPVTDLQPYLDTYAHLTAFHDGDLAFAHLHPQGTVHGDRGGPDLTFEAMLPAPGNWRLFLQFQTAGVVHTAAVTLAVT